ncbi:MAG: anaerobic ribonucleoside-triphosphate reductase activating protein [Ruminococcaceae bacterium]|nr:anaerobic ribonucleoside-triphosphate reductase activating protein [Oscillospiraceae bacterium]
MNYGEIKNVDIANGTGVRVSMFVSGCTHHCKGCFNPETWNFNFGLEYTDKVEDELIEALKPNYIEGLSLLGGEPFEPENQKTLVNLLKRIKKELPEKNIWVYSGYLFEELTGEKESRAFTDITLEMLSMVDVLVDGEFIEELKDISLQFRGSSNQRIIDVQQSLKNNEIIKRTF